MNRSFCLLLLIVQCAVWSCSKEVSRESQKPEVKKLRVANDNIRKDRTDLGLGLDKLSEYGFFEAPMKKLIPVGNVVPYDLNTPLFSDYAHKARFIKFPDGVKAQYDEKEVLNFPVGTVLIKNFYYPTDFNQPEGERRILETRLLLNEDEGWQALSYIWNDEQTEAFLEVTGGTVDVSWKHSDGVIRNVAYSIPNLNQCKNCHAYNNANRPIGPSARQLNRDYEFADGGHNQLEYMSDRGYLDGLPQLSAVPKLALWNPDSDEDIADRARAYLDVNCGSCHRPEGSGNTSGLYLHYHEQSEAALGVGKAPVAAGRGSGGLKYDIFPGHPEESILLHRMKSLDPGVMMPEMGRKLRHEEGIALIEAWIRSMGD
ncbi:MAG: SO2930 family diheme c-type cytochrome [Bacteroidota bacterium]